MLRVHGERRCARIAVTTKLSCSRLLQQLHRDSASYDDVACHLQIDQMLWWISNVVSTHEHQVGDCFRLHQVGDCFRCCS